ncbi:hypothetical protein NEOLI_001413 [Neolecta irregularis DAH-3]|uniref:Uncharacterized protein n=1 Tax=Neolecta irregularis (strain DAH-3) TaxID=1198029 RepID=A0A1U7LHQ3_NEOID|nr:hypothetical protein NEOLI_001413 [Neolecta irregularis DAH-3]|eukprot:OLL22190.1 hypothetical protein NEOLI_001413 [Neolecta irregularis DAH-3]
MPQINNQGLFEKDIALRSPVPKFSSSSGTRKWNKPGPSNLDQPVSSTGFGRAINNIQRPIATNQSGVNSTILSKSTPLSSKNVRQKNFEHLFLTSPMPQFVNQTFQTISKTPNRTMNLLTPYKAIHSTKNPLSEKATLLHPLQQTIGTVKGVKFPRKPKVASYDEPVVQLHVQSVSEGISTMSPQSNQKESNYQESNDKPTLPDSQVNQPADTCCHGRLQALDDLNYAISPQCVDVEDQASKDRPVEILTEFMAAEEPVIHESGDVFTSSIARTPVEKTPVNTTCLFDPEKGSSRIPRRHSNRLIRNPISPPLSSSPQQVPPPLLEHKNEKPFQSPIEVPVKKDVSSMKIPQTAKSKISRCTRTVGLPITERLKKTINQRAFPKRNLDKSEKDFHKTIIQIPKTYAIGPYWELPTGERRKSHPPGEWWKACEHLEKQELVKKREQSPIDDEELPVIRVGKRRRRTIAIINHEDDNPDKITGHAVVEEPILVPEKEKPETFDFSD